MFCCACYTVGMTQKEALEILKLGHNVFLTGAAGSGKTHCLRSFIAWLKEHSIPHAVTASTGIAATHLEGMTIHSWSGLGIRDALDDYDCDALIQKPNLNKRWNNTRVLIIDEVSMLHHYRLDMLDLLAREMRGSEHPFGGIQVVLSGDFFQLPPVSRHGEREARFVYESNAWGALSIRPCYLEEQHRQDDGEMLRILTNIRDDDVGEHTLEPLRTRYRKAPKGGIEPTLLYTHNVDVERINAAELSKLDGAEKEYKMTSKGRKNLVESIKKSCLAPERLRLKVGARVMFVKNSYERGYVNGTLGKVVELAPLGPIVETVSGKRISAIPESWVVEDDGKVRAEITQVPLRLAWAITVHKSQGMSLDAVETDLSRCFEPGMGYVALSRVRTLGGLNLLGLNPTALSVHPDVMVRDMEFRSASAALASELAQMTKADLATKQASRLREIAPTKEEREKAQKIPTHERTLSALRSLGKPTLSELARARELGEETIIVHLEKLLDEYRITAERDLSCLRPSKARLEKALAEFRKLKEKEDDNLYDSSGRLRLSPVRDKLGPTYSWQELRLARLFL